MNLVSIMSVTYYKHLVNISILNFLHSEKHIKTTRVESEVLG
jgi:hypothetical protein